MPKRKLSIWSRKWLGKIIRVFFGIICFLGVIFFLKSDFWQIKRVVCRQDGEGCETEIWQEVVNLTFGKNIILLSTKPIREGILGKNPTLKEIKIKKKLPNELGVEIKKRQAVVALGVELTLETEATPSGKPGWETGKGFYLLDEDGVLVKKVDKSDLPLILLKEQPVLNIGQKITDEKIIQTIRFLTNLRLNLFEPKIARLFSSYSLEIWLKEGIVVFFSLKKEIQPQVDSLQMILSRAKIEGKVIGKIDLRFDKAVVNYE